MIDQGKRSSWGLDDAAPPAVASSRHLIIFLCLLAGRVALGLFLTQSLQPRSSASRVLLYSAAIANQILFIFLVVIGIRARGVTLFDLIGKGWRSLRDGARDVLLALLLLLVVFAVSSALSYLPSGGGNGTASLVVFLPKTPLEKSVWIVVGVTAGICEEIIFRGYLQRQFWALTQSLPLAIGLQALLFGSGHFYQGWQFGIGIAAYGIVFGLLAAWRKSLMPGIVAHSLTDVIGGLVGG